LTGHTGFKGGWCALWLNLLKAEVLGYSLEPPTDPSFYEAVRLSDYVQTIIGDVRDYDFLLDTLKRFRPEIVFHFAAQALVRSSYADPKETFETNIMGTVNLLEAIRQVPEVRAVVIVTSDKCYENKEWVYGYREHDEMGGADPYSASKGCAELLVSAYRRSFFRPGGDGDIHRTAIASVRAGNVMGGGDWAADRLVPDCVRAFSKDEQVTLRNPKAYRPWQFILDPLYGYLILGALLYKGEVEFAEGWNLGPDIEKGYSVLDVVKLVARFWGSGSYQITPDASSPEAGLLQLDTSKAWYRLGWRPIYSTKETLEKTIAWYKLFYDDSSADMTEFSVRMIREYMKRLSLKD